MSEPSWTCRCGKATVHFQHLASLGSARCLMCGDGFGDEAFQLRAQLEEARAEARRYREALEQVEFVPIDGDDLACPWCNLFVNHGHAPDCPRQLALHPKEEK